MSLVVSIHELAEVELIEASQYYESEVVGLGQAFLTEVDHTVDQIRTFPEAAPIILKVVRQKLLRRFPYSVMYSLKENKVFILAIANHYRRPFYWRGRL